MIRHVAGLAVFWLALVAAGCTQCGGDPERAAIEPMVFGLQERLKPDGGTVSRVSGPRWDRRGVHAAWDVETGMDWTAYTAWVRGRIPADFRVDPESGDRTMLVLRKSAPGDCYVVQLEPIGSGSPLRVRIIFDGFPN